MLTDRRTAHAIVVLLDEDAEAEALARMLGDLSTDEANSLVCLPPVRGIAFFADAAVQRQLDAWWAARIPRSIATGLRRGPSSGSGPMARRSRCDMLRGSPLGVRGVRVPHGTDARAVIVRSPSTTPQR